MILSRKQALLLVASCAFACEHERVLAPIAETRADSHLGHATSLVRVTNAGVTGYWRASPDENPAAPELWLYRNEPELGFNASTPDDLRWMSPDSSGSTLIRYAIYWEDPVAESIARLAAEVAAAPDGATILVVVHSKSVCVDYTVNGDRLAKYQQYADYVRALAEQAPRSGRVRVLYWQIYNEMNIEGWTNMFGGPMLDSNGTCRGDGASQFVQGERYADLLKLVYPAIKQATHDSAWVVSGAFGAVDSSLDAYSPEGRYGFLHGMYANGGKRFFDIAAIQPYGDPGVLAIRRTSDLERALAVYGDETRPVFMTEFGSKKPDPDQWPDLHEQIESAKATRLYNKIFIFIMCGGTGQPYSMRRTAPGGRQCGVASTAYDGLRARQYNARLYSADSLVYTDVFVPGAGAAMTPLEYDYVRGAAGLKILHVPVHYREPSRIRFEPVGVAPTREAGIEYRAFVDGFGWTGWSGDSAIAASVAFARPIDALQMRTVGAPDTRVVYSVLQNGRWSAWVGDGAMAGDTTGNAAAIRAQLQSLDGARVPALCYEWHAVAGEWSRPHCDADPSGTPGARLPAMDAVRLWLVP